MLVFFFQAEDGIRVIGVTGVQTCALPIFLTHGRRSRGEPVERVGVPRCKPGMSRREHRAPERSEERRVGKECGFRRPRFLQTKRLTMMFVMYMVAMRVVLIRSDGL